VADRPSNAGREDTVVRPLQGQPPAPPAARPTRPAPSGSPTGSTTTRTQQNPVTPAPTATPATGTAATKPGSTPAAKKGSAAKPAARRTPQPRPGRRARLRLTRVDPWSVMKTAFLLSIALGVVCVVAVLILWTVLGAADVWGSINTTVRDVVGGQDANDFNIQDYLGTRRVVGFTMIIAAVDVVLLTAIATLGAFLYNMSASLLGGVEVTLAEDN
jgi:hypothetical protein